MSLTTYTSIDVSPSLIVGCMIIAGIMTACFAFFIWRRIRFGYWSLVDIRAQETLGPSSLGERPGLWDVWSDPSLNWPNHAGWQRFMPLSAMVLPHPSTLLQQKTDVVQCYDFQQVVGRLRQRTMPDAGAAQSKMGECGREKPSQMQIMMLIVMPRASSHADEVLEYSFGTMAVPWDSESC